MLDRHRKIIVCSHSTNMVHRTWELLSWAYLMTTGKNGFPVRSRPSSGKGTVLFLASLPLTGRPQRPPFTPQHLFIEKLTPLLSIHTSSHLLHYLLHFHHFISLPLLLLIFHFIIKPLPHSAYLSQLGFLIPVPNGNPGNP